MRFIFFGISLIFQRPGWWQRKPISTSVTQGILTPPVGGKLVPMTPAVPAPWSHYLPSVLHPWCKYISNHIPHSQTPLPGHRGSLHREVVGGSTSQASPWRASAVRSKTIAVELEFWTHLSKSNVVGSCLLTPKEMSCVECNTFIVDARGCRYSKYSSRHFIFIFYMCPVSSFKFYFSSGHYEQIRAG